MWVKRKPPAVEVFNELLKNKCRVLEVKMITVANIKLFLLLPSQWEN
jgi:hypothetical protein